MTNAKNYPLISIIIPVYNVAPYLQKCLNSVTNQTYDNLEIILVDDGSSDMSSKICDECASKDNRVIVIHKKNGGQSDARNHGLEICRGQYVSFVDGDDWVERNYIEVLYSELIRCNSDISIINHNHYSVDGSYNVVKKLKKKTTTGIECLKLLITKEPIQHLMMWGKLYKRDLFREIRFPVGKIFEEHLVCYKIYYKARKITSCNEVLYHYLKRPDSTMGKATNIDYMPMWDEQAVFFKEKKEFELAYIVYFRIAKLCLWNFYCCPKISKGGEEQQFLDKARFYCCKAEGVKSKRAFSFYVLKLFVLHPILYIHYRSIIDFVHALFRNNP